jgi:hypothetical protein
MNEHSNYHTYTVGASKTNNITEGGKKQHTLATLSTSYCPSVPVAKLDKLLPTVFAHL